MSSMSRSKFCTSRLTVQATMGLGSVCRSRLLVIPCDPLPLGAPGGRISGDHPALRRRSAPPDSSIGTGFPLSAKVLGK